MDDGWWRLPGPEAWLGALAASLRDGRNIVLCLPEHGPADVGSALRARLGDDWSWCRIRVDEVAAVAPAEVLHERLGLGSPPSALRDAPSLAVRQEMRGRLVWLEHIPSGSWPAWRSFLGAWEHATRALAVPWRGLLAVCLIGADADGPPAEDVALAVHRWSGAVDELDMMLYVSRLVPRQEETSRAIRRRLDVATIAALSLWDGATARRLTAAVTTAVMDWTAALLDVANRRGWSPGDSVAWSAGVVERFGGREQLHSSWLALNGQRDDIERRIWRAQVAVLLPWVEERRQSLLGELRGRLHVPWTTRFGETITDLRDLEVGHIEAQLTAAGPPPSPATREVQVLRRIRNHLSHLEPVPADLLRRLSSDSRSRPGPRRGADPAVGSPIPRLADSEP